MGGGGGGGGYYEYIVGYHVSTGGWIKYIWHYTCRELTDKSLLKFILKTLMY